MINIYDGYTYDFVVDVENKDWMHVFKSIYQDKWQETLRRYCRCVFKVDEEQGILVDSCETAPMPASLVVEDENLFGTMKVDWNDVLVFVLYPTGKTGPYLKHSLAAQVLQVTDDDGKLLAILQIRKDGDSILDSDHLYIDEDTGWWEIAGKMKEWNFRRLDKKPWELESL